jgi:hypothetical protein
VLSGRKAKKRFYLETIYLEVRELFALFRRNIKITVAAFIIAAIAAGAIGSYSYLRALKTANELVEPVREYYELEDSTLLFRWFPGRDRAELAFEFTYWNGTRWDEEFYIYISPFGNIVATNPTTLRARIDEMVSGKSDYLKSLKKWSELRGTSAEDLSH